MTRSIARSGIIVVFAFMFVASLLGGATTAAAKAPAKDKKVEAAPPPGATGPANACGCYTNAQGGCLCTRKAKCGCAGECEPKGCEEKRQKEIDRQISEETKKAADAEKKQRKAGGGERGQDKAKAPPADKDSEKQ